MRIFTDVWLNKINDKGKLIYYIARHFMARQDVFEQS